MPNPYLSGVDPNLIRPGLSRCAELLDRLGRPQDRLQFVHIAGTNGKGSTAACLASILRCAGYRTGLFTSPALEDFSERVQIDGVPIPAESLSAYQSAVHAAADAMQDPPTEFERATALALLYFAEERCDLAVLEAGLGGTDDATNVIPAPEAAVLTAMGMDHTALLGDTQEKIAAAKAGILKPGSIAVSFGNSPVSNAVFAARCAALDIPLIQADFARIQDLRTDLSGSRFRLQPYGEIALPLVGAYQAKNAILAVTAAEALRSRGRCIPAFSVVQGLAEVRWPGRLELLRRNPIFLLDGSHNPQGLQATLESLAPLLSRKPVVLISVMRDKEIPAMLHLLLPFAAAFVTVTAQQARALPAGELAERIRAAGGTAQACRTIAGGVETALHRAGPDGAVCALGTLYFSSDVRRAVKKTEED